MRIGDFQIEPAPEDRVRLRCTVTYSGSPHPPESYWYEVPASVADGLDVGPNPWIATMLPLAAILGEPLEWDLDSPADRSLVLGARELLRVWRSWYETTQIIPLRGPTADAPRFPTSRRTCAFLSGGVDSFFTALDHMDQDALDERGPIDEFLFVAGFDLRLDAREGIARALESLTEVADALGRPLVFVRTNLREPGTRFREAVNWGMWGHGPVLAAVPLALGRRYGQALIPSSSFYPIFGPWGSHPYTDALLSSSTLRVRDDGSAHDRIDKIRLVSPSELVRRHLRVCFDTMEGRNCGRCRKCLIAMMALDVFVGLQNCPTFPDELNFKAIRGLRIESHWHIRHLVRLREVATEAGRKDILGTVNYLLGWRGRFRMRRRALAERLIGRQTLARRAGRSVRALFRRRPQDEPAALPPANGLESSRPRLSQH